MAVFELTVVSFCLFPLPLAGTSSRRAWKELTLTGGTASPSSTTTTCSWRVSSSSCCPSCCTCCDCGESTGAQPSAAPRHLYRGWKRAWAHPRSLSPSKFYTSPGRMSDFPKPSHSFSVDSLSLWVRELLRASPKTAETWDRGDHWTNGDDLVWLFIWAHEAVVNIEMCLSESMFLPATYSSVRIKRQLIYLFL